MTSVATSRSTWFVKFSIAICLGAFVAETLWVVLDAPRFAPWADFKVFYAAGRIVAEGHGHELYSRDRMAATLQKTIPGIIKYFFNPPVFVLPFVALSFLPLMRAYWIWSLLSLAALFAGLAVMVRLSRLRGEHAWLLATAALACEPTFRNLHHGNISAFVLLLAALFFRDLVEGRERRAGVWLALLMVKPELFLLSGVVLAAKKRWDALRTYLACGLALLLISLAIVGIEGFSQYMDLNLTAVRGYNPAESELKIREMPNWRGLSVRILGGGILADGLALGLACLSLVALGLVWRDSWEPSRGRFRLQWALTVLITLQVTPHVHPQSLILVGLAAALALGHAREENLVAGLERFPRLALMAVALSWLPVLDPIWGVTALQAALIAITGLLLYRLLARPAGGAQRVPA